jgi:hypothetical protein
VSRYNLEPDIKAKLSYALSYYVSRNKNERIWYVEEILILKMADEFRGL